MKPVLLLSALLVTQFAFAQIPNGDFESWTDMGSYNNPDGWANLNDATAVLGVFTCEQGSPGTSGDYYMKLTSKNVLAVGVVPGVAVSGSIDMVTYTAAGGFPYAERPVSLNGKWQYMAFGGDQGYVAGALTKWNTATSNTDTVAYLYYPLPGMEMSWKSFSLDWIYVSTETPDSALIVFSSSGISPASNSYLYLDALTFSGGTTGIEDVDAHQFSIYPNPANENIHVADMTHLQGDVQQMILTDISGKIVYSADQFESNIDLSSLPSGQYFLSIILPDNKLHYPIIKE